MTQQKPQRHRQGEEAADLEPPAPGRSPSAAPRLHARGLTLASLQFWSSMMIWSSSSFLSLASVVTFSSCSFWRALSSSSSCSSSSYRGAGETVRGGGPCGPPPARGGSVCNTGVRGREARSGRVAPRSAVPPRARPSRSPRPLTLAAASTGAGKPDGPRPRWQRRRPLRCLRSRPRRPISGVRPRPLLYLDVLLHFLLLGLQVLAALLLLLHPGLQVMADLFQLLLLGGQAGPQLFRLGTQFRFRLELLLQL